MKFKVRHYYVVDLEVEEDSADEALELATTNEHEIGVVEAPEDGSGVKILGVEYYDNIEVEAVEM